MPKAATGALGDALRNLQQYVQKETFNNPQGGTKDPGQAIQFDTKGVEFGPWIRRFVQKVRRNWFVPDAAFTFHGRVVLQFNIHRDGHITDVVVAQPSDIDAFNRAAFNAILRIEPGRAAAARVPRRQGLLHRHVLLQRVALQLGRLRLGAPTMPTRTQQLGLILLLAALVALVAWRVA